MHRLPGLPKPVDVDDRGQVVEPVERGMLDRLPDGSLGHLRVTAQHPDPVRKAVEPLAGQRDADRDGQALAERAGRDVDPGKIGVGWPSMRLPSLRKVSISSSEMAPAAL